MVGKGSRRLPRFKATKSPPIYFRLLVELEAIAENGSDGYLPQFCSAYFSCGDRLGEGDRAAGLCDMQRLDEAPLHADGALAGGNRLGIARDDPARPRRLPPPRPQHLLVPAHPPPVAHPLAF